MTRIGVAAVVVALVVGGCWPIGAAADVTVNDGTNSLTLSARFSTVRHRDRGVALRMRFDIARLDGGRPLGFSGIRFDLPSGARFNPRAVAQCPETTIWRDGTVNLARCPRGSRIGSGVVHIDARPLVTDPVSADATLINGLAEWGNDDQPFSPPRPAIFVAAQALGVQALFAATFDRGGRGVLVDLGEPVSSPAPFTITGLSLRIRRAGTKARPYLRAPAKCSGSWPLSITYLFASPLTARDATACRAPN